MGCPPCSRHSIGTVKRNALANEERELSAILERCVRLSELLILLATTVAGKPSAN